MSSPDTPPTWDDLNATRLTARLGYTLDDGSLTLWHWCTNTSTWTSAAIPAAQVTSAAPLDVEPALRWPCCALHGHIHNGTWIPTNPPTT